MLAPQSKSRALTLGGAALILVTALVLAFWGATADVFWSLRLPRVLHGFAVGALLALSGLAMQVLLRNPLADPYVLGTSGGAAVGAISALLFGLAMWVGAVCGALLACGVLLVLAQRALRLQGDATAVHMVLIGSMLAATLGAVATLLLTLTSDEQLRGAVFWLVGDLSSALGMGVGLALPWLMGLCFVLYFWHRRRSIDRLMLGAQTAWQLGEPVQRLRIELLVLCGLAVACAVAQAGAIGFVGLVVPQFLRMRGVYGSAPLAALSAVGGGSLLVLSDAVARQVASPLELPVGAITALLGAPLMVWFLARGVRA